MRYKIGDFAKILDTSIRTLRYYDEMNLILGKEQLLEVLSKDDILFPT